MAMEFRPHKQNERAKEEFDARAIHHSDDLFDQNESAAGEKVDLATGKPIDNSTSTGLEDLAEIEPGKADILPALKDEEDEAEHWLKANDPLRRKDDLDMAA